LGGNYLKEEYVMCLFPELRLFRNSDIDIENNSRWRDSHAQTATLHTKEHVTV